MNYYQLNGMTIRRLIKFLADDPEFIKQVINDDDVLDYTDSIYKRYCAAEREEGFKTLERNEFHAFIGVLIWFTDSVRVHSFAMQAAKVASLKQRKRDF